MGIFDKMKLAVGIGGAKVEVKLEPGPVPLGGFVKGQVIIKAGKAEQKCNGVPCALKRSQVVTVRNDDGTKRKETRWDTLAEENLANYSQTLHPESVLTYEFTFQLPNEEGPELSYEVSASADIPGAIDPSGSAKIPTTKAAPLTAAAVPQLMSTANRLHEQGSDKYAELEGVLKQVLGFEPENIEALHMMAKVVGYRNEAQAVPFWTRYLEKVPSDARAWSDFARNAQYRDSYEEALKHLNKALELAPLSSDYWSSKAEILTRLKRTEEAIAAYDKALEGDSPSTYYYVSKARLQKEAGRQGDAIMTFHKAARKGETYILDDVLKGLDELGATGQDEAITAAIEANKESPRPLIIKANWLLAQRKAPVDALKVLEGALQQTWSSEWERSDLWCTKGQVLEATGNKAEAKVAYQKALGEYADNTEAKRRLKAL